MTGEDDGDDIKVLLYSYYTAIKGGLGFRVYGGSS